MTLPRDSLSKMKKGFYRYGIEPTIVEGNFTIGAAATFYETQQGGQGCIVARTGAGTYTITLDDTDVVEVYSAVATIQDDTGAHTDLIARAEDITITAGVATIDIEAYAAAVATDVLTANHLFCHFTIVYSRAWAGQPDTNPVGYYHHVTDAVMVCGGVDIGAVGAVGAHHGDGFALTRTGAGDYLLTFTDAFNSFWSGVVNAGNASGVGGDLSANFGAFTPGAAGAATLTIGTQVAAVATDPANGGRINFVVYLNGEASGA
jgi:hypothetical protein